MSNACFSFGFRFDFIIILVLILLIVGFICVCHLLALVFGVFCVYQGSDIGVDFISLPFYAFVPAILHILLFCSLMKSTGFRKFSRNSSLRILCVLYYIMDCCLLLGYVCCILLFKQCLIL